MNYKINVEQFRDLFGKNTNYKNQFSYLALGLIFDWYNEHQPEYFFDMGEIVEIWSDYDNFQELENDFYYLVDENEYNELETDEEKADYLIKETLRREASQVIKYNNDAAFLLRR